MVVELKVPAVGESITEVEIAEWRKGAGESVRQDEAVVVLETEKATVEIPAPVGGRISQILKKKGDKATVGEVIGYLEEGSEAAVATPKPAGESKSTITSKDVTESAKAEVRVMPAAQRLATEKQVDLKTVKPTGPGGRVLKEDVAAVSSVAKPVQATVAGPAIRVAGREEETVPMTLLRRKIAERLVQAQHNAALLTTFNEVDMSTVMTLRTQSQEDFQKKHGIKLGFMSFFVKAVIDALKQIPQLNAEIRGTDIIYKNYFDIGIAVGSGKGLVVPVIRNAERLSFAEVEQVIADYGTRAKDNKLKPDELQGGTFTISNGGIYGSMLSTPIINPPQSGILGMHAIQDRPVARAGQVVIRPMMYLALSYDHRLVDGREAVTFLKRVKDSLETPALMLLEV